MTVVLRSSKYCHCMHAGDLHKPLLFCAEASCQRRYSPVASDWASHSSLLQYVRMVNDRLIEQGM